MATIVTLDPVWQGSDGADIEVGATIDSPALIGGGSVSDGSDDSWVEMAAWKDNTPVTHYEPLSCDFVLPSAFSNPTAIAMKLRLRTDPDVFSDPAPLSFPSSVILTLHAASDGTFLGRSLGGGSQVVMVDIRTGNIPTIADRTFWFDDVDLDDPTDAGFWFEFAVDADDPDACVAALFGDGLRASIAIDAGDALDTPERRHAWLDIYEFQLLVACDAAGLTPPCHLYPRDDDQGVGTSAIWPPASSGGPGSYY